MENKTIEIAKLDQFLCNIKVLRELTKNNPKLDYLKRYAGFGGLRQCFNSKQLYGLMMNEIRLLFGKELEHDILSSVKQSLTNAYYTPKEIVTFIYRYISNVCNFKGGEILEPSCGNGVFFEYMPEPIKLNSVITGVELDTLTSKLVQNIYKDVRIINQELQTINFGDKKFDLIIGNPPYGKNIVIDNFMPDLNNYTIHHYFIAKCMRLLKNNGILVFVMPSFFLDIPRKNTRAIINNEAVLIDAIRLPENIFTQATVTVDIIIIRKTGNKIHNFVNAELLEQDGKKDYIKRLL